MLWSLWLWDVLHALHTNLSLNFSPNELLSRAPSSTLGFQDIYRSLLQESNSDTQSVMMKMTNCREQAVLLLLAILADTITIRRSLGSALNLANSNVQNNLYKHNPFVPLSARTELERMERQMSTALDRWYIKFESSMAPDIMSLYHYSRLYLSCPVIPTLTRLARYEPSFPNTSLSDIPEISISARSVSHAWALLDVAARSPASEEVSCPAWMPIVVFHAALVVWAKTRVCIGAERDQSGSVRALLAFKVELEAMPWPCCVDMAATLQRLMSS